MSDVATPLDVGQWTRQRTEDNGLNLFVPIAPKWLALGSGDGNDNVMMMMMMVVVVMMLLLLMMMMLDADDDDNNDDIHAAEVLLFNCFFMPLGVPLFQNNVLRHS